MRDFYFVVQAPMSFEGQAAALRGIAALIEDEQAPLYGVCLLDNGAVAAQREWRAHGGVVISVGLGDDAGAEWFVARLKAVANLTVRRLPDPK